MLLGSHANYEPPGWCRPLLGSVLTSLKSEHTVILPYLTGARHICKLPGGQIYYESGLELDSDGSIYARQDKTGQGGTSLRAHGHPVDANSIPYFVLPGGFPSKHHIRLGDIAAVLHRGQIAFAVFADSGPAWKIGEGSIALHRALGHETIRGGRLHDVGISAEVITIVFPHSGDHTPQSPQRIQAKGRAILANLVAQPLIVK
jgi:hypothetical protein